MCINVRAEVGSVYKLHRFDISFFHIITSTFLQKEAASDKLKLREGNTYCRIKEQVEFIK